MKLNYSFIFKGKHRCSTLFLIDVLCFVLVNSTYFILAKRFSYSTPVNNFSIYLLNSLILLFFTFLFRLVFKIYKNVWRYTNTKAYFSLVIADGCAGVMALIVDRFVINLIFKNFYIGVWHAVTVTSLTAIITLMSRFTYRLMYKNQYANGKSIDVDKAPIRIAIVGAGQLGAHLASELLSSPASHYRPYCFIDNDQAKVGKIVSGLPVCSSENVEDAIRKYSVSEVVFAIADKDGTKIDSLWKHYTQLGCKVKIYDSPFHDENTEKLERKRIIRDFAIEDLLFRKPLNINDREEFAYYREKTVLVTGGGGSIGSELCRQISKCKPKKLIIFDIYENNAYDIQQELIRKYGDKLDLAVEIGSVRDKDRLECLFENYRPDIVFHAAAHKHVPLMEHSGCEAIKNNVIGTYNTANMAEKYGVEKFILISTDKAVNPTNVMGASKRLCEMVIQCRNDSNTSFAAVRFGNVLGSNGSVIPLFKRQIAAGGPVTITDKRIVRYFMTIPEASQLVLQAGAKAKKGELFVLDMGQSVKIYDLAVNMIKLMGYVPEEDIKIEEIGLRPGEKLYEELLMKTEELDKTDNNMIFIERDAPLSREEVNKKIDILLEAVESSKHSVNSDAIRTAIKKTVPTYRDPDEVNKNAEKSKEMKNAADNEKAFSVAK